MADKSAIAIKRQLATERIVASANGIAQELGVEALSLPLVGRDTDFLHAQQLEALASYFENIHVAITPVEKEDTNGETKNKRPPVKKD